MSCVTFCNYAKGDKKDNSIEFWNMFFIPQTKQSAGLNQTSPKFGMPTFLKIILNRNSIKIYVFSPSKNAESRFITKRHESQ